MGSHGKTPWPQPVVSLKDTMGTMGWDPQTNEEDILGAGEIHSSAANRATGLFFRIGILASRRFLKNLMKNHQKHAIRIANALIKSKLAIRSPSYDLGVPQKYIFVNLGVASHGPHGTL